jgi:hypothetical protein
LINHYGFIKEEIKNLVKKTPKILILDLNEQEGGLKTLEKFFIHEKG